MRRILSVTVLHLILALCLEAAPHRASGGWFSKPTTDPFNAVGELRMTRGDGTAGGSATIIGPRRADGKWDVLTAGHVVDGGTGKGSITMKDGRKIAVTATNINNRCDVCWLVTDRNDLVGLPFAVVARNDPAEGTGIWICGYCNREDWHAKIRNGVVAPGGMTQEGQLRFRVDIDRGDSGGGIFRADTNELVGVTSWYDHPGQPGLMGGGGAPSQIHPGRPR